MPAAPKMTRSGHRTPWWIDNADAAAVVECFLACARERAQTPPEDHERLADEDGDLLLYDAYWEDGELVVSLCRQFALIEDGEDQEYLDRLNRCGPRLRQPRLQSHPPSRAQEARM